ncbi:hypothetical protein GQ457_17G004530 [Hibiscus cannabinus]
MGSLRPTSTTATTEQFIVSTLEVLKGLYFPSGNIFMAPKGRNPSWAWASIHEGLNLIKEGSLWRVGNGLKISIWEDKWLPSLSGQRFVLRKPHLCRVFRVADLMDISNRQWREDLLHSLFPDEVVKTIVYIPVGNSHVKDELIWENSKDGNYSIRTGYYLPFKNRNSTQNACSSNDLSNDKSLWKSIWNLKVPSKIKFFIWKACLDIVPTKGNLFKRFHGQFGGGPSCPRCGECFESMEHTLFFCPFALTVWKFSDFGYEPEKIGFSGFGNWWKKLSTLNTKGEFSDGLNILAFLCWHIWKSRNALVFSNVLESPVDVWNRAFGAYEECCSTMNSRFSQQESGFSHCHVPPTVLSWSTPPSGFLKINCDAAYDRKNGYVAVACIARDEQGQIIKGENCTLSSWSVSIAEAIAIRKGVMLAINEGWEKVIFESDNLGVINGINSFMSYAWESTSVIKDILSLAAPFPLFSFQFVKRDCNMATDWVVKTSLKGILKWVLKVLVFCSMLEVFPLTLAAGCSEADRAALLGFKARIFKDSTDSLSSWIGKVLGVIQLGESMHWHCKDHLSQLLNLSRNGFSNPLPAISSKGVPSLLSIDLSFNNLSLGTVPNWIIDRQLSDVSLAGCKLRGAFPKFRPDSLSSLDLSDNLFTGSISTHFSNMTSLQKLMLSNNQLKFDLSELMVPDGISTIDLHSNQVSGSLSSILNNRTSSFLEVIDVSNNFISGTIPEFTEGSSLKVLNIGSNKIAGQVPSSISNLIELKRLDVSRNQITGTIPASLGQLVKLEWLDVSINRLTGKIPTSLMGIKSMTHANFRANRLCGEIPQGRPYNIFPASTYAYNMCLCGKPLQPCKGKKQEMVPVNA